MICRRRFFRLVHCAGSIFLPFGSPSCFSFFAVLRVARGGEAAESECFAPDNNPVWIDASINPTGPRVSPSGHPSRRCHPAPDPKGFALWTPSRRCRPAPGPKVSPLDTDQTLTALDLAQRACRPLHSRRSPRLSSCPCSLSGVLFSLVRSMRYFTREHIRFGRSFFFQAAMLCDRNIVAEKMPLSRISKR